MIAVTGANGLVGSYIVKKLVAEGLPVRVIIRSSADRQLLADCIDKIDVRAADILDEQSLREAMTGVQTMIHTAAMVSYNPRHRKKIFEVNVEGTRNIVNACLELGTSRLIHVSSVAALGKVKGDQTVDESNDWASDSTTSDYAESKYLAELEVYRGIEEGLAADLVNPSVVLAPADWNKTSAQIFRYVSDEKPFYTTGSINYVDARDVAEIIFRIYKNKPSGQRYIANAGVIPFKDFFEAVAKRLHKKHPTIKVERRWLRLAVMWESIVSRISGRDPLVTMATARAASETVFYDHRKTKKVLEMEFISLDETLNWCCAFYSAKDTTNN